MRVGQDVPLVVQDDAGTGAPGAAAGGADGDDARRGLHGGGGDGVDIVLVVDDDCAGLVAAADGRGAGPGVAKHFTGTNRCHSAAHEPCCEDACHQGTDAEACLPARGILGVWREAGASVGRPLASARHGVAVLVLLLAIMSGLAVERLPLGVDGAGCTRQFLGFMGPCGAVLPVPCVVATLLSPGGSTIPILSRCRAVSGLLRALLLPRAPAVPLVVLRDRPWGLILSHGTSFHARLTLTMTRPAGTSSDVC
ncbi:hypothetical protein ARTHRO8AJ_160002 [Arthrobacter sp. 8AJ]|nr:hypothetical protein ARTHRO8AJ_160002 [Arthrobacter sp. 8AJ]